MANPSDMDTTPMDPNTTLVRARALKATISTRPAILHPLAEQSKTLQSPSSDPELQLIKKLRSEQGMKWADIAAQLNSGREKAGEAPIHSASSTYSRFVLAVPTTATPVGEIGFNTKDYVHLRNPHQYYVPPASAAASGKGKTQPISKLGKKRVRNYDNATELKSNVRQRATQEQVEELRGPVRTQMLVEAVAKVERNFWKLVADEMERTGTTLYEGEELAKRWHGL